VMRSFTVDAGGPIYVADFGGSGQVALLVHGLAGSHVTWMSVAGELARDHRVLAIDLPGFGRSPMKGRRATVAANVAVLDQVIGKLADGPIALMGNSMGGLISLGVAAERPSKVAALVLVDPAVPLPRREVWRPDPFARVFMLAYALPRVGLRRLARRAVRLGPERIVREVLAVTTVDPSLIDPGLVAALIALEGERLEGSDWQIAIYEASRSLLRTLALRRHFERWVAAVTAPTLLVHGRRDRLVSHRSARAVADLRPDWEFHLIDDVGHVPMMESPRQFLDVVEPWLQRLPNTWRASDDESVGSVA
jgi:pimeloyl-ACP methyl ester carboxylesterase